MAKKLSNPEPMGPVLAENLVRLGYADVVVRSAEIARMVSEATGRSMSRQRVSALLNAVRVEPSTIELIAKGLGVDPSELTKRSKR